MKRFAYGDRSTTISEKKDVRCWLTRHVPSDLLVFLFWWRRWVLLFHERRQRMFHQLQSTGNQYSSVLWQSLPWRRTRMPPQPWKPQQRQHSSGRKESTRTTQLLATTQRHKPTISKDCVYFCCHWYTVDGDGTGGVVRSSFWCCCYGSVCNKKGKILGFQSKGWKVQLPFSAPKVAGTVLQLR